MYAIFSENIPKDLRDISTLKLDSFSKKRAEFLVLPKLGDDNFYIHFGDFSGNNNILYR